MHVSARALVDEQAAGHVDANDGPFVAVGRGQPEAIHENALQGGLDGVRTDVADEFRHGVQTLQRDAQNLVSPVLDPEYEHSPARIGERGKRIGEVIPPGRRDALARESYLLVLQSRALPEPQRVERCRSTIEHHWSPS